MIKKRKQHRATLAKPGKHCEKLQAAWQELSGGERSDQGSILAPFNSISANRHFPPSEAPLLGERTGWAPALCLSLSLSFCPRPLAREQAPSWPTRRVDGHTSEPLSRRGARWRSGLCLAARGGTRTRGPPAPGSSRYPCGHRGASQAPGARARTGRGEEGRRSGARARAAGGRPRALSQASQGIQRQQEEALPRARAAGRAGAR